MIRRDEALSYHSEGRPGKIALQVTKPCSTQRDLSLAYTPGVAEPCREIHKNEDEAFKYTARGNLVAVVSNGTAVLGLGRIGALASKPVMEGKGVLFKRFADIDVFDLEVGSEDPDDTIRFCELLEPTVGGINLEDIAAPDCFYIEETLLERLNIPVFHDDQHGTAIISGAGLVNALEVAEKDISEVRIVVSGAGASGIACAEHYIALGAQRENIFMIDSKGVIHSERDNLNPYKARFAHKTKFRKLADALKDADVFIGLSQPGVITGDDIKTMAEDPIVFAMANPDPEILPEEAHAARKDVIMATGRSDYPNQVNNVLGFPFIFRGALDVRAKSTNQEMKMAATHALAALAKEPVPEAVARAYGVDKLGFGRDYLIPKPIDYRVLLYEAPAVARAAMESGVARVEIDLEEYRNQLEGRLGRAREVTRNIVVKAQNAPRLQRILFPEATDDRILHAARSCLEERIAMPILVGDPKRIARAVEEGQIDLDLDQVEIVDPLDHPRRDVYIDRFFQKRQRKGITRGEAAERLEKPIYYAAMMLHMGDADGLIAGEEMHYPEALRPCLETVGVLPGSEHIAGLYMMVFEKDVMFFADTTVNITPDAETLAETAILAARFAQRLSIDPRVAMISFSNFGSARHPESNKVARAVEIVKERCSDLVIDGEMQADTAVVPDILKKRYPFSTLQSAANILVFPDLNAANAAYKLMARIGGASAIGPILLGMPKPVHILQRGSDVLDIINLTAIAVVDALERQAEESPLLAKA
ncbi:MAG: NADP-dependent malic enzyme [Gemmatimonadetes bacterium]|uniref:NADP-dependent malic enzyme n=1 Tax=Candidatus Kutchimonas denitrificans TaxID=3056748 RepID=A0AAE4Z4N4_9BACT|nr:NADP-dependent malic enzyme [Gemmatimonadota bacterium]NIR73685.1 NADP-dependent malic enzyme [Candidatus Kutchimonas denitrificans]NIS00735.1 NADP-dependent malic enzyme [Gemmatimonadota bacterium]NIT66322.1 NADP-dependent malic enzyme [Gemmatimonadota bacterium]NIU51540.1 NADP-dependent malic enzyme [Gemmatimonadota bacterium]